MTIFERIPNPLDATQKLSQILANPSADADTAPVESKLARPADDEGDAAAQEADSCDMFFGDPTSARRMAKIIAIANTQSAHIIGVTGARPGVGVTVTSRQLAGAISNFGRKTLLVDLSGVDFSSLGSAHAPAAPITLLDYASEIRPGLSVVDGTAVPLLHEKTLSELHHALDTASRSGYTIIVDLPPVLQKSGQPVPATAISGAACDLVFLVCLSGTMQRKDLISCVQTCAIMELKVGGLILNDWKLPGSSILES